MSRSLNRDDYLLMTGAASMCALGLVALSAMMPFVEARELTNGVRAALAAALLLCAAGAAAVAVRLYRRSRTAPAGGPVPASTREAARTSAVVLVAGQLAVMVAVTAYGFSAGRPLVGVMGAVATCSFGVLLWTLLRRRASPKSPDAT